jgi:phosphoglycerate dehydrogenase-like enzyme
MRILSTIGLTPEQRRIIEEAAGDAELKDRRCRSQAEMAEAAEGGCDVLFTLRVPDELMVRSPQLKWVQLMSAGADHVLKGVLVERKSVAVTTGSGVAASTIAEYTIASMLAWAHAFPITMRAQLGREWKRSGFMDIEPIRGKTLGVIGYGSIGRETARIAEWKSWPLSATRISGGMTDGIHPVSATPMVRSHAAGTVRIIAKTLCGRPTT